MKTFHVADIKSHCSPHSGGTRLKLRQDSEQIDIFIEYTLPAELSAAFSGHQPDLGDLALYVLLIPAMKLGYPITGLPPLSEPEVAHRIGKAQRLLKSWFPELLVVDFREDASRSAPPESAARPRRGLTAAFFSGGIDAWHAVIENISAIDCLIAVHGFDVPHEDSQTWARVLSSLSTAAREIGKPLICVTTNLRDFSNCRAEWDIYHGTALAAVAAALSPAISCFFIGSSSPFQNLYPLGSHPQLDPLWNGKGRSLIHYGCHANRVEKAGIVAAFPPALNSLRVCWKNPSKYNCSECRKCGLTMMALDVCGKLLECPTFAPKDVAALAESADFSNIAARNTYNDLIHSYRKSKSNPSVLEALLRARRNYYLRSFRNKTIRLFLPRRIKRRLVKLLKR